MRRTFLTLLFTALAFRAFADPKPIAPAPISPTSFNIDHASIAALDGRFLSIWQTNAGGVLRIDKMPLSPDGRPANATSSTMLSGTDEWPALVRAGSSFLLALGSGSATRLVRISIDGMLAEVVGYFPAGTVFGSSADGQRVLALRDDSASSGGSGVLMDASGRVVTNDIPLPSRIYTSINPAGEDLLLVDDASGVIRLQRIRSDGVVEQEGAIASPRPDRLFVFPPVAASDGQRHLVAWRTSSGNTAAAIVANGSAKAMSVPQGVWQETAPMAVVWTGEQYVMIVIAGPPTARVIAAIRFDADGVALDPDPVVIARSETQWIAYAGAAWNGSVVSVLASEPGRGLFVISFAGAGPIRNAQSNWVALAPARQTNPAAASDGVHSLAAWIESSAGERRVRASLITNGTPAEPVTIANDAQAARVTVAYGGGIHLVVWQSERAIVAARVSASGALLDGNPLTLRIVEGYIPFTHALAFNGEDFLVIWDTGSAAPPITGAFVSPAGTIRQHDAIVPAIDAQSSLSRPTLASNGERFVLSYRLFTPVAYYPPYVSGTAEIVVVPLTHDGRGEASPRSVTDNGDAPTVSSGGSEFLITFTQAKRTKGIWLNRFGQPEGASFDIGAGPYEDVASSVAWIGGQYAIARHTLEGSSWRMVTSFLTPGAASVRLESSVASRPDNGYVTTALSGRYGSAVVLYTDIRDAEDGGSTRLMIDTLDEGSITKGRRRAVGH